MSTMGDRAVHTLFLTDLNKATLDAVPVAQRLDMEEEGRDGGGGGARVEAEEEEMLL